MKKISLITLLSLSLFAVFSCIQAQEEKNDHNLFVQGNEWYKSGAYQKAFDCYERISAKTNAIYFNSGNCLYKMKQHGKALAYWKRAEQDWGWSGYDELAHNINHIKKQLGMDSSRDTGLKCMISKLSASLSSWLRRTPLLWFQMLALFVWIFLFMYIAYLHRKGKRLIIVPLFAMLAFVAGLLGLKYSQRAHLGAVIIAQNSALRSGPSEDFQLLVTLPEGKEVTVKKLMHDYSKIALPNNTIGWVRAAELELV